MRGRFTSLILLLMAAGCRGGKHPDPPAGLVFYTQPAPSGCQWNLLDLKAQETRLLYVTSQCPDKVIWDARRRETIFTLDPSSSAILYKAAWQGSSPIISLGARGDIADLWISRDGGRLRRVEFIETTNENTVSESSATYFLYKGGRYPTQELAAEDGIAGMAVVEEWDDSSAWTVVSALSTTWGAGDSMGTYVVESFMEKDPMTVTLQELLQSATCAAQGCPDDLSQAPAAVKNRLQELFPGIGRRAGDGVRYEPLKAGEGLLFSTDMADTIHAGGPVYYCRQDCRETKRLGSGFEFGQMSVSTQAACALLTEEYSGDRASIVCAGLSIPPLLLKQSHSAVWFPLRELWPLAKPAVSKAS